MFFENSAEYLLLKESCEDFSFYISYHDVIFKRNGMLLNFFSKHFDEKCMNKEK